MIIGLHTTPEGSSWSLTLLEKQDATALLAAHTAIEAFRATDPTKTTDRNSQNAERIALATNQVIAKLLEAEDTLPERPNSSSHSITFPQEEAQILAGSAYEAKRLAPTLKTPLALEHIRVLGGLNAELDYFFQTDD